MPTTMEGNPIAREFRDAPREDDPPCRGRGLDAELASRAFQRAKATNALVPVSAMERKRSTTLLHVVICSEGPTRRIFYASLEIADT